MNPENATTDLTDSDSTSQEPLAPTGRERLMQIAEQLEAGGQRTESVTPRELLRWFGASRRGPLIVKSIRSSLSDAKLATKPDFEGAYVDGPIEFILVDAHPLAETDDHVSVSETASVLVTGPLSVDPTYRIGKLPSANRTPISVKPQQKITEAITIMLVNDFSQLPVMEGERDVKGIISWATIGSRLALGVKCSEVRECMDSPHVISADTSLFAAINEIVNNQYVLVRDSTNKISGIVTTSDLSLQFRQLAEPFLLLGEIENHIRRIIERGSFTETDLRESCDPGVGERTVDGVYDLTFGEYIRLLENEKRWLQLSLDIDRKIFIGALDKVRQIRNDVMHFDPDPVSEEDLLETLRRFTGFLQRLQSVLPEAH
jgi:CBS domain-containing protein